MNDTILVGLPEDLHHLYLGVDSNIFKYRIEINSTTIYEAYQEWDTALKKVFLWIIVFFPQLFLDEDVRVLPYAKIELEGHKWELSLAANETSALVILTNEKYQLWVLFHNALNNCRSEEQIYRGGF